MSRMMLWGGICKVKCDAVEKSKSCKIKCNFYFFLPSHFFLASHPLILLSSYIMRFLLLLFLCLSHLALSVDITISSFSIDGKTYKNPTVSYKEGATTATIFYDDGVHAVSITQIPHSILPKLNLSPEKVAKIIADNKAKFKKAHDELKRREEISKEVESYEKKVYQTLKNSLRVNFYPIALHPEIPHCYIGHPTFPRTKKIDKSKTIAVLTSPPLEVLYKEKIFSLKKIHSIMTIDATPIIYNGKEIITLLYTCDADSYKVRLYLYKPQKNKR